MKKPTTHIFVLTYQQNIPEQGGSHNVPVLAQKGTHGWSFEGWHPAFTNLKDAQEYRKTCKDQSLEIESIPLNP